MYRDTGKRACGEGDVTRAESETTADYLQTKRGYESKPVGRTS
jgi:hypothetical protein